MFTFVLTTAAYFIYTVLWFAIVQKPLFALYNRKSSGEPLTLRNTADVYAHGLESDAIVAGHLSLLPLIALGVCSMIPDVNPVAGLTVYNAVLAVAVGLAVTADTALYKFWQFKLDSSVFVYLRSIKGAAASVSGAYIFVAAAVWALLSALYFTGIQLLCLAIYGNLPCSAGAASPWWMYALAATVITACTLLLLVIIRGRPGKRPKNPSVVFFSKNAFFNHWALNPGYSLIYSLSTKDYFKNDLAFFTKEGDEAYVKELFPTEGTPAKKLLRTERPNILFVIWESFGAEFTGVLGGNSKGITPCADALAGESVLFTRCTAGGCRTDRGLVNLLSGYPAQPTGTIVRHTRILPHLPGLARTLSRNGYITEAMHGGDMSRMHKRVYYLASGHDRLKDESDYPLSAPKCKWGIHDHYMMEQAFGEMQRLAAEEKPFFLTLQTLSSHAPFEVPYKRLDDKVENSMAYTDHSLGQLVDKLKASPLWDNLLLVVVADHGMNIPDAPLDHAASSHIPLIFGGGAINGPQRIDTIMSQTDVAATLLGQLGMKHDDFGFSRDVLADTYTRPFALHVFSNGFMVRDERGCTIYDTLSDSVTEGADPQRERAGKATIQQVYEELRRL